VFIGDIAYSLSFRDVHADPNTMFLMFSCYWCQKYKYWFLDVSYLLIYKNILMTFWCSSLVLFISYHYALLFY